MLETVTYWIIGVGLAFDVFGCIGLVRLPDVYNRAQAATKCVTLGTCMILIGLAVLGFGRAGAEPIRWAVKALLCAVFVLLTSPVAAHAVCRGAYLSRVPLWEGSVTDEFAPRADAIRDEQADEGAPEGEKAQTS